MSLRRILMLVVFVLVSGIAGAEGVKFISSTSASSGAVTRYRVTLAATADDRDAVIRQLLTICRCRTEMYAQEGFSGFVINAAPSAARLLSSDPRVALVQEMPSDTPSPIDRGVEVAESGPEPEVIPEPAARSLQPVVTTIDAAWKLGPYAYDGAGNIASIGTDDYQYDAYGRLTAASVRGSSQTYTYDRYGNQTSRKTGGTTTTLGVDASTNRSTIAGVQYDSAGRVTHTPIASFTYDAADMMVEANVDGGRSIHIYSASDERIGSIGVSSSNVQTGWSDWAIRDLGGKVLRRYRRQPTGWTWEQDYIYRDGQLLASELASSPRTRQYHADHLGTPRLITDDHGMKVSSHDYYAFGEEITPHTQERVQFTGHERDHPSLDYMHARYYNALWGRFLSVDPTWASADLGTPQSWNRYAYVRNNPVNLTDPDGREPNVMQSGSLAGFLRAIRLIESQHPKETPGQILNRVTGYLSAHADDAGNARYLYTTEGGWIDQKHFFKAAAVALERGEMDTNILGIGFEFVEQIGTSSFLSYEDLPSNRAGADFGDDYFYPDGSPLSSQAGRYLTELGATDPQNSPNYMLLPPDKVDHGGSGSGGPGQSGRDAKNGLPCTGEGGPCPP